MEKSNGLIRNWHSGLPSWSIMLTPTVLPRAPNTQHKIVIQLTYINRKCFIKTYSMIPETADYLKQQEILNFLGLQWMKYFVSEITCNAHIQSWSWSIKKVCLTSTVNSCRGRISCGILIVYFSLPVRPNVSAFSPSKNCRGTIPMPTRLDLWIRS